MGNPTVLLMYFLLKNGWFSIAILILSEGIHFFFTLPLSKHQLLIFLCLIPSNGPGTGQLFRGALDVT